MLGQASWQSRVVQGPAIAWQGTGASSCCGRAAILQEQSAAMQSARALSQTPSRWLKRLQRVLKPILPALSGDCDLSSRERMMKRSTPGASPQHSSHQPVRSALREPQVPFIRTPTSATAQMNSRRLQQKGSSLVGHDQEAKALRQRRCHAQTQRTAMLMFLPSNYPTARPPQISQHCN